MLAAAALALCAWSAAARAEGTAIVDATVEAAGDGALSDTEQRELVAHIRSVGRRGFLYEVVRPAPGARRLFLYGTIHLGRSGSEPFNGPLFDALRGSQRIALEADPSDGAQTRSLAMELGRYGPGDALDRHLSPELLRRVTAFGERHHMTQDQLLRIRPWLLAEMIALTDFADAGFDASMGGEYYLVGFARGMKTPIVEIEGLAAQLHLLAGLPDDLQAAQLDESLSEYDRGTSRDESRKLFALWLDGDAARGDAMVADLHREAEGKRFERYFVDVLIDARNRRMADTAERFLERPGNTFFAVGALHLFGDAGLVREFERRGYRVADLQAGMRAR